MNNTLLLPMVINNNLPEDLRYNVSIVGESKPFSAPYSICFYCLSYAILINSSALAIADKEHGRKEKEKLAKLIHFCMIYSKMRANVSNRSNEIPIIRNIYNTEILCIHTTDGAHIYRINLLHTVCDGIK